MKYSGGCHCGNVKYEVEMKLENLITCNCSICQKRGSILGFVPEPEFKLLQGTDSLKDYQFNKKVIHHLFCTNCGVSSFAKAVAPDGKKMVAVNVRCLDGVDAHTLEVTKYNGKSI